MSETRLILISLALSLICGLFFFIYGQVELFPDMKAKEALQASLWISSLAFLVIVIGIGSRFPNHKRK